jgi:hypothetical protein
MLWRVLGLALLLVATGSPAGSSALIGDEIKQTVAGAVFEVDTPLGTKLPINYAEDGRMSADAGALAYLLGSARDSGNWWISANKLCQKWRHWFDGAVHCLRLSREGTRIFWSRDDGESGTASLVSRSDRGLTEPASRRQQEAKANDVKAPAISPPSATAATTPRAMALAPDRGDTDVADEAPLAERPWTPQPDNARKAETDPRSTLPAPTAAAKPASALRASAFAQPPPARALPSFRVAGVDYDDVLNVRNGPSADHDVIASILPDAAGIKIVGPCVSAWCPIQHRGVTGWVNSAYLSQSGAP